MSANPFVRLPARCSARDKYGPAMLIEDQVEADAYFEACVSHAMEHGGFTREKAEEIERANLAYFAGYYGDDVRARVERIFRCVHPIFGPIAKGRPTTEQAVIAGVLLAAGLGGGSPDGR